MKLKVFDRILLALLLIVAIVCAFVLFAVAARLIPEVMALDFVALFYANAANALILAAAGLVLLLVSIKLMFAGRSRQAPQPAATMIRQSDIGGAYIALSAIDTMVQKHCRQQGKVRDCGSSLHAVENGVAIALKLSVLPDTDIVTLTDELQKSLKEYIESLTGVNVQEISILVENTAPQTAAVSRVE
ncbi:MAG: alkaline shock response membrane anchor protein AmaP [Clostridia bacterium]|nr:alkaline shock response membrane anchor protein AmaP [Clostridia bacterium]